MVYLVLSRVITPKITFVILPNQTVFFIFKYYTSKFLKKSLRKKPSIQLDSYSNSGVKNVNFSHVRTIESQNSSKHTVTSILPAKMYFFS